MHDPLAEIRRVLVDRHGCHTVVLYGSRAHGDVRPGSDWDVLGVRLHGATVREVRPIGDGWLDAFVHDEAHFTKLDEGSLRFLDGRVLVDSKGFAAELLARVSAFERNGPPPLDENEEATLRAWFPKTLERVRRDDTEARYRRAQLLVDALEAWFHLRGRWFRGPKQGLVQLRDLDPGAYALFERALAPTATPDDLSVLVGCVLGG
ncbi:MAG: nucleotidyltransferase domain-containing protein [Myxococcales bacterium]|nr:nucleotidyltransferase domain-containing protein [Myxococcales bacterium]